MNNETQTFDTKDMDCNVGGLCVEKEGTSAGTAGFGEWVQSGLGDYGIGIITGVVFGAIIVAAVLTLRKKSVK